MYPDPLGRAMLDHQRGDYEAGALRYRDGAATEPGHVVEYYFADPSEWSDFAWRRMDRVEGPVIDVGCGAGQHARWLQDRFETLAVDVSPHAVRAARERGVENVAVMDMFEGLGVPANKFRTVHCVGTQATLARSTVDLAGLLSEFARVTDADGRALVDGLDPRAYGNNDEPFGYRPDPRPGIAWRTFHFEYGERVGPTLVFRLFSPDRLREAAAATEWRVVDVLRRESGAHFVGVLEKDRRD